MSAPTAPKRRQRRPRVRSTDLTRPQTTIDAEENGPPLRVAIYLRISTDELHQPFSLEAQHLKLRNYVTSQDNWELVGKPYIDEKSGATTDRPALKRALAAARAGKFDVLLVYRVDRLSRSIRGLSEILADLEDAGAAFRSATEPFDTATPAGRMMVQMLAVFAEFERATIIDRVINGMERKAARGEWPGGYRPHGYERHDGGKLVIVDYEKPVVQRIFTMYVTDKLGTQLVAKRLSADGYRTKAGNPWSKAAVLTVLRNRTYLGEIWFRDRWYKAEDHHPAIISEKLFNDAQDILDARGDEAGHRAVANSDYILAGRLFCSHCGKRYLGTAAKGNKYRYRYYTCFTKHRYGTAYCAADRLPADQLEHAVLTSLLDTLTRSDLIEQGLANTASEVDDQRATYTDELAAVERDITKNEDAIDRYLTAFENGTMDEETCSPRVQKLATKLTEQRARRDELGLLVDEATAPEMPDITVLETLRADIEAAADTGSVEALRRVMQTFVHRVDITSRETATPTFVIPADADVPTQRSAAAPPGATTERKVRTLAGSVPPAGLEPATPALGERCSIL